MNRVIAGPHRVAGEVVDLRDHAGHGGDDASVTVGGAVHDRTRQRDGAPEGIGLETVRRRGAGCLGPEA